MNREQDQFERPAQRDRGIWGNYDTHTDHSVHYEPPAMRKYGNRGKKPYRGGGGRGGYHRGGGPRHASNDDDETMRDGQPGTSHGPQRRYSPYGPNRRNNPIHNRRNLAMDKPSGEVLRRIGVPVRGRGGRRDGRYNTFNDALSGNADSWFKVKIPHGSKYDKNYILRLLTSASNTPFIPVQYNQESTATVFFVQDIKAAQSLKSITGQITTDKGFKLVLYVNSTKGPATSSVTPADIDKLKVIMSARYDPPTKALNLSSFHSDDSLKSQGMYMPLNRQYVARAVLNIIVENIPEIETLDLQANDLSYLSQFADLRTKAPNLVRLNLGKNTISSINELDTFREVSLVELILDGNPLCDKFDNEASYVSAIRKKFPKVMKLDGHDLPAPVSFDVDSQAKLPPSQDSFLGDNAEVKKLVCMFIQQYFEIFDSKDRGKLLDAYHDHAVLSLSIYTNNAVTGWQPKIGDYMSLHRNIAKSTDLAKSLKYMQHGKVNVVAELSKLPETKHDLPSFLVDIVHFSVSVLIFSVQGTYKEVASNPTKPYLRTFNRVFVTVPQGPGIAIINEHLTVTNATTAVTKKAFQSPPTTPSVSAAALTPEQQSQLVQKFSQDSGMNAEWSAKCLQENNYEYEVSAKMFTDLQAAGSIPPEAFNR